MNELLKFAIEAHGGIERWNEVKSIELDLTISGALFEIKGFADPLKTQLLIDADVQRTRMYPYGGAGRTGTFTPHKVWIETSDGTVVESRDNPRDSFEGHIRPTPWDQLHRLYFLGYAMWNYLATPFVFAQEGFNVEELAPHVEENETWRVLNVNYPKGFATHCSPQKHYFDEQGLLKRVDYVTDIAGGIATHYCYDPKPFDGLIIPTRRRVVQRLPDGPKISGKTSVFLDYHAVKIHDRS